jgi:hypothetical protein
VSSIRITWPPRPQPTALHDSVGHVMDMPADSPFTTMVSVRMVRTSHSTKPPKAVKIPAFRPNYVPFT